MSLKTWVLSWFKPSCYYTVAMGTCEGLTVYISLDRETEEVKTRNFSIPSERDVGGEKKKHHTRHKETPTTRASPFIVHNTSLFSSISRSVHVLFISINCYRGTWQGFAKQEEFFWRVVSVLFFKNQRREGKQEGGRVQSETRSMPTTRYVTEASRV